MNKPEAEMLQWPQPDLRTKCKGKAKQVSYPSSCIYIGGIAHKHRWYKGVQVPGPLLLPGWELKSMGVGQQLNCFPPHSTAWLQPISQSE